MKPQAVSKRKDRNAVALDSEQVNLVNCYREFLLIFIIALHYIAVQYVTHDYIQLPYSILRMITLHCSTV